MENIHSKNDKANEIIYFIGMGCFMQGWDMMRLEGKLKPTNLNTFNPVYVIKDEDKVIHYLGFEDKTETIHIWVPETNEFEELSYDEALKQFTNKKI